MQDVIEQPTPFSHRGTFAADCLVPEMVPEKFHVRGLSGARQALRLVRYPMLQMSSRI